MDNWKYIVKFFREGAECRKEVKPDLQKVATEFGKLVKEEYPDGYDPKTSCDTIASLVGGPTIEGANPKLAKFHWNEIGDRFEQNDTVHNKEKIWEVCGWSDSPDDENVTEESTPDSTDDTEENTPDPTDDTQEGT